MKKSREPKNAFFDGSGFPGEMSALDCEQAVLGGLMMRADMLPRISDWLGESDFLLAEHQLIWRAICALATGGMPFDAVTISEWLHEQGFFDTEGNAFQGGAFVTEIACTTASGANVEAYAELVLEKSRRRQLRQQAENLLLAAQAHDGRSAGEIALSAQHTLLALSSGTHRQAIKTESEMSKAWFQALSNRHSAAEGLLGLPTPWQVLNRATEGLRAGELIVVAARPSMGKSAFAINLMSSTALSGKRALLFSLEMLSTAIYNRAIASEMEVPLGWLRAAGTGRYSDADYWSQVTEGVRRFKGSGLLVDDQSGLTAAQIVAKAQRAHLQAPLDIVIIDHLHLVKLGDKDVHRELGEVTEQFKSLAKKLGCPVVVLSQLNRGLESRPNKRPQMHDLRESGAIEQNADLIVFMYRDDYYAKREQRPSDYPGWVELFIAKQREGESGQTIWLRDRLSIGKLDDYDGPTPQKQVPAHQDDDSFKPRSNFNNRNRSRLRLVGKEAATGSY